ncbi:sulfite exporter TauE/SafE family protein [Pectinatus haikarae]|uniref:Probable membrane transporter protein n=1 Tax=Pectinatus haikarae TaxID=349096 RepID=A0ABT9Y830_9FIRM|nr:sulfite exporter TauE/SafE family protein [Pectinatus haikarae]MDQ0203991.1 putative membrane protein YfcA [Pectinatus haikarae]
MEAVLLFIIGIGVGAFGTLVGIGGGLIMVPLFVLVMTGKADAPPSFFNTFHTVSQAVGTSLVGIFLNTLSGTLAYIKQKKVYFDAAIPFAAATLPGAFIGSYVDDYFTGELFDMLFGVMLIILSVIMYWKSSAAKAKAEYFDKENFKYSKKLGIFISIFVGFLSSVLGIGGGVIHVPLMIYVLSFPPHVATATSHFILAISSFAGSISHIMLNHVVWQPAIAIGGGTAVGAQLGASISQKTKPRIIVVLLSAVMCILGVKLILMAGIR